MPPSRLIHSNARMVHRYLTFMRHARGRSISTIDQISAAIMDFEQSTGGKDFRLFKPAWAIRYKEYLAARPSQNTPGKLAPSTVISRLSKIEHFFQWLCEQEGYRSKIKFCDTSYFAPTRHETGMANSRRRRQIPTVEQIVHIVRALPASKDEELRNRALIAFILLSGARANAAASFSLGNIDLNARTIFFDSQTTRTKNRKAYTADFFPVGDEIETIVTDWVHHLHQVKLFSNSDPLFPATSVSKGEQLVFEADGLSRTFWKSSEPIRRIFKLSCERAGVPYLNPHSLRTTLGLLGQQITTTHEEFKAWSQNLGHESIDTTFRSYGHIGEFRQAELMDVIRKRLE
ncbi:recombinase XerC [Phyllobacterium brassicacearum]|uniref:Recombinase XerC n=1 Tax=Phyllobacterium brassicacearum TaxID=314235 RepID=A0A2P7BBB3_9HYPH|nr:tyrosine-type recombinase/integrase [Phyllobacterium brassicacearum]PSH63754.1 recombinase XerC [Phyllobacterium brassicacearum]TDQ31963.1 site-specific recombinase XerD [Phyllobacterium brassicacearum]